MNGSAQDLEVFERWLLCNALHTSPVGIAGLIAPLTILRECQCPALLPSTANRYTYG